MKVLPVFLLFLAVVNAAVIKRDLDSINSSKVQERDEECIDPYCGGGARRDLSSSINDI